MKNLKKGSTTVAILVIIIVVLIGVIGYQYLGSTLNQSQMQTNTQPLFEQNNVPQINTQASPSNFQSNKSLLPSNNVVSVRISVSGMNENVYTLVEPASLLGLKYIFPRSTLGDSNIIKSIDPSLLSMGDSCWATVSATLEISDPKIEGTHPTLHGDATVAVNVVKVVSHGVPQKSCAY